MSTLEEIRKQNERYKSMVKKATGKEAYVLLDEYFSSEYSNIIFNRRGLLNFFRNEYSQYEYSESQKIVMLLHNLIPYYKGDKRRELKESNKEANIASKITETKLGNDWRQVKDITNIDPFVIIDEYFSSEYSRFMNGGLKAFVKNEFSQYNLQQDVLLKSLKKLMEPYRLAKRAAKGNGNKMSNIMTEERLENELKDLKKNTRILPVEHEYENLKKHNENILVEREDNTFKENAGIKPSNYKDKVLRTCPSCGAKGSGNFCSNCGAAFSNICPNCGTEGYGNFCSNCGANLNIKMDKNTLISKLEIIKEDIEKILNGSSNYDKAKRAYDKKNYNSEYIEQQIASNYGVVNPRLQEKFEEYKRDNEILHNMFEDIDYAKKDLIKQTGDWFPMDFLTVHAVEHFVYYLQNGIVQDMHEAVNKYMTEIENEQFNERILAQEQANQEAMLNMLGKIYAEEKRNRTLNEIIAWDTWDMKHKK